MRESIRKLPKYRMNYGNKKKWKKRRKLFLSGIPLSPLQFAPLTTVWLLGSL